MPAETEEYLTVDDVAELLQISDQTVYAHLRSGALPGRKIGRQWRVPRSAVEAMFKEQTDDDQAAEATDPLPIRRRARRRAGAGG